MTAKIKQSQIAFSDYTKCVYVSALIGSDSNSGLNQFFPKATLQAAWNVAKGLSPSTTARVAVICNDASYFSIITDNYLLTIDANCIDLYMPMATLAYNGSTFHPTILITKDPVFNPDNIIVANEIINNHDVGIYYDLTGVTAANSRLVLNVNKMTGATYGLQLYHGGVTLYGYIGYLTGATNAISDNSGESEFHLNVGKCATTCQFYGTSSGELNLGSSPAVSGLPNSITLNGTRYGGINATYTGPWASGPGVGIYLNRIGNVVLATFLTAVATANGTTAQITLADGTIPAGFRPVADMNRGGIGVIQNNTTTIQGTIIVLTTGAVRIGDFPGATAVASTNGQNAGFLTFDMSWYTS